MHQEDMFTECTSRKPWHSGVGCLPEAIMALMANLGIQLVEMKVAEDDTVSEIEDS